MTRTASFILLIAGTAQAVEPVTPQLSPHATMPSRHVAHIYYNVATGERIATLLADGVRPTESGVSDPVWLSDNALPCADFGQTTGTVLIVDTVPCSTCFSSACDSPRTGRIFMDWGDIPADQVIDCVGVSWSTQIIDTDVDGDGIGDGVDGFAAKWIWTDAYNGFSTFPGSLMLTSEVMLTNLPGALEPFDPENEIATYFATVDLAGAAGGSAAFELGDTDSMDNSGTGQFNPGSGADLDGDGLADFGYGIQFIQPGSADLDGDGQLDGDIFQAATSGWLLAMPPGTAVQDSNDNWDFFPDPPPAAQGAEDAYELWSDCNGSNPAIVPFGTFFFGGFSCDLDGDGVPGDTVPFAQTYVRMYGPDGGCVACPADVFPDDGSACGGGDGLLNFFDISTFIGWFTSQDPRADVFPGTGGDGVFNFFDVNLFIGAFTAGCP